MTKKVNKTILRSLVQLKSFLKRRQANSGFTIVELLVIIGVISLILAVGSSNYAEVKKTARDSQRIEELTTMAELVRLFEMENGPLDCDNGVRLEENYFKRENVDAADWSTQCADRDLLISHIAAHLEEPPSDPLGPGHERYFYFIDWHNCGGGNQNLIVFAQMENPESSNRLEVCPTPSPGSPTSANGGWYNYHAPTNQVNYPYAIIVH